MLRVLRQHERRRYGDENAFTLIELLVVIVILGILAAVVVFAVAGVDDKGQAAADAIDERTLRTAEEAHYALKGGYATEAQLVAAGLLGDESETHKIYVNGGPGACPAASSCEYAIARDEEESALLAYVGRTEAHVTELLDNFQADTGISVTRNYAGGSGGRAQALLAEGTSSPADVFFSQDAGNLGQVSRAGLFLPLPSGAGARVADERLVAGDRTWAGVSARVRVIAYNPAKLSAAGLSLPGSVFELTGPAWAGKVAYDPANASYQSFVAAMLLEHGPAVTNAWLVDFKNNGALKPGGNQAIARSVADPSHPAVLGLVNHYYRFQTDPPLPGTLFIAPGIPAANQPNVQNHFPPGTDPAFEGHVGSLVNVAGVGIVKHTANPGAAEMFVKYLLSWHGQEYFRDKLSEYPVVADVPARGDQTPLSAVPRPDIDLNDIDIDAARTAITAAGQ